MRKMHPKRIIFLYEGSIPFTRSTLFLSKFAVFQATVLRVSYDIV